MALNPLRSFFLNFAKSARFSPFVISKALAARMTKLITARARKNIRTARMLANARKDHSIPLVLAMTTATAGKTPSKK